MSRKESSREESAASAPSESSGAGDGAVSDAKMERHTQYVSIAELARISGMSLSTLHRLKRTGRIPYFQPGGKGARILFPRDALERSTPMDSKVGDSHDIQEFKDQKRKLPGPQPKWMRSDFLK